MKIELNIPDDEVLQILHDLMDNYPEYSSGNALQYVRGDRKNLIFTFLDEETGKRHILTKETLVAGFEKFLHLALEGVDAGEADISGRPRRHSLSDLLDAGNYDAELTDMVVQCAIFGKVIYG